MVMLIVTDPAGIVLENPVARRASVPATTGSPAVSAQSELGLKVGSISLRYVDNACQHDGEGFTFPLESNCCNESTWQNPRKLGGNIGTRSSAFTIRHDVSPSPLKAAAIVVSPT